MRTRLWLIILVLAWIGQSATNRSPVQTATCGEVWFVVEDLTAQVEYEARRRALEPRSRSHTGPRHRRGGRKRPFWRPRASTASEKEKEAEAEQAQEAKNASVLDPQRWGLTPELSQVLPDRLRSFWARYAKNLKTKTRDTSEYAYHYLSALLRLEGRRNYTTIGRAAGISGENIQHFMSNSPWGTQTSLEQVREEIKATPGLERGGVLLLDESADESGEKKAVAGRQHNGRLGKVDMSQVGFETKIEKGWKMIRRVQAQGLPFEAVACDDLYGRSTWLRDQLAGAEMVYMADVPCNTQVYLERPELGVPERKPGSRGPQPTRIQVLNGVEPFSVHRVARRTDTTWTRVRVRSIERGELHDPFAARRVWTLREGKTEPVEEWLVVRREASHHYNYSLSNAPVDTAIEDLAWLKCQRYFVERANQDAKSEAGWDELEARKYRGWEHHLALVILAVWFAAQTKWEWARKIVRDPALAQQLAVEVLPALSMANIRILLRAAVPLPQLTSEQAIALIAEHLVNRTRSRAKSLHSKQPQMHRHNVPLSN